MILRFHKTFLFLLALLLCCCGAIAQNKYLDSLKHVLNKKDLPDSSRMAILIEIGNNVAMNNPHLAKENFLAVFSIAKKNKDRYYMAMALSGMGVAEQYLNSDSTIYFSLLADSLYALDTSQRAKESRATNKSSIADIERNRNNYESAIRIYLEAVNIMEKSGAPDRGLALGVLYAKIGSVYHDMDQFSKALYYDLRSLASYKKDKSSGMYVAATELFVAGDYVNLHQLESAKTHIINAETMAKKINSADLFYRVYNSWGSFYKKDSSYAQAIASYNRAFQYAKSTGNLFQQMNCNRMIGFIYKDMKKPGESITFLKKALAQTRELNNKRLEVDLIKNMAWDESLLGNNANAVDYYQQYIHLSDSLNEKEIKQKINEIENKYQVKKKQENIIALQKNNLLQKIQLKQKNTINIALVAGCTLLLLVVILFYTNFKNKNRLLLQKEKLHDQQISELEKERKLIAAQSLMKGQEEERTRLARDLHDGIGGLLSGVKLSMSNMKGNVFLSEENAQSVNNVIAQLDQSIAELRRVSHNMMPESLIKYGLIEALENYCESLTLSGKIKVQLQAYGMEQRMEQSSEIVIYRMTQELLNNVTKHAEAKNVLIQLVRKEDRFNLTVEDDGKGFDIKEIEKERGAGLVNIRARAEYLNGNVDIISVRGEGTSVTIEGNCS